MTHALLIVVFVMLAIIAYIKIIEIREERKRMKETAEAWKKIANHACKHNLPLPRPLNEWY